MTTRFDVLALGNAIVDVISPIEESFLAEHETVKGSMTLIDEDRAEFLYKKMGPATEISGGSGANTAVGVASFGNTAAFAGKIRDDQLGDVFRHDITAAGVTFNTESASQGPATARSFILITPDGERTMNTFLGACVGFSPQDVDEEMVKASIITYMEGYLWDPEPAKRAFMKAADIARSAGREVSLTLSDGFCVDRYRNSFLELVKRDVDIVFANEDEIKTLYQVDNFDDALQAVRVDCKLAALTRSSAGSVIVSGDEVHIVDAVPVESVVDTTGAGDMFAAGFLAGYTKGKELVQCAEMGSLAAAEIISHIGARPTESFKELAKSHKLL